MSSSKEANQPERVAVLKKSTSKRDLQKLTGLLQFTTKVVQPGIEVDGAMHNDLVTTMKTRGQADDSVSDNLKNIFWLQQVKVTLMKDELFMRWHLAIICWCLYLYHPIVATVLLYRTQVC